MAGCATGAKNHEKMSTFVLAVLSTFIAPLSYRRKRRSAFSGSSVSSLIDNDGAATESMRLISVKETVAGAGEHAVRAGPVLHSWG